MSTKSLGPLEYELRAAFERIREQLLADPKEEWIDLPLGQWVTGADRRLPVPFLGRRVRDLLTTPFDNLFGTAVIGKRKFETFIVLLNRVLEEGTAGFRPVGEQSQPILVASNPHEINAASVTEHDWLDWRNRVEAFGLGRETLGRCARSLKQVPRVLWRVPLGNYTTLTLAEIRSLKTHGERRVGAVVSVFASLNQALTALEASNHLVFHPIPRFVERIDTWADQACRRGTLSVAEVFDGLLRPLLDQLRTDVGEEASDLLGVRLCAATPAPSLSQAAAQLGIAAGKASYLVDEACWALEARWRERSSLFERLASSIDPNCAASHWLSDAVAVLTPHRNRYEAVAHSGGREFSGEVVIDRPVATHWPSLVPA